MKPKKNEPKKCPDCKRVYQISNKSTIYAHTYLADFPAYGLERKVCKHCKPLKEVVYG
jgi:hypothetical protein